eukprot:1121840-Rhodomonas_salina.1
MIFNQPEHHDPLTSCTGAPGTTVVLVALASRMHTRSMDAVPPPGVLEDVFCVVKWGEAKLVVAKGQAVTLDCGFSCGYSGSLPGLGIPSFANLPNCFYKY